MNTPIRQFRTDMASIKRAVGEVSKENNIPRLEYPSTPSPIPATPANPAPMVATVEGGEGAPEKKARTPRKSNPAALRRVAVDLPDYLVKAIAKASLDKNATKRFIYLEAFRASGFSINDADMQEDGRREQP